MPADEKIKEIEEGIQPLFIETIRDPHEVLRLALELARSTREEALVLFSTANSFLRNWNLGFQEILKEIASKYRVKIRILTPLNHSIKQQIQGYRYAEFRHIPEELQTKLTFAVVDRKSLLVGETKDDTKDSALEAMGLGYI